MMNFFDKWVDNSQKNDIQVRNVLKYDFYHKAYFVLKTYFQRKSDSSKIICVKSVSTHISLTLLKNANVKNSLTFG